MSALRHRSLLPSSTWWEPCSRRSSIRILRAERIKGAIALYELDGFDPSPVIDQAANVLLTRYLSRVPQGVWMDQYDADGNGTSKTVPSSTLYHLFLAFAEALRISE